MIICVLEINNRWHTLSRPGRVTRCVGGQVVRLEHAEFLVRDQSKTDEITRSTDVTKRAYTDGLLAVIDDVAARLASDDPNGARLKTLSVFALMVGTLQVSRALANRQLADEVLEQGIQNALALLGPEHPSIRRR